jgi:hypothetical protein
LQGVRHRLEAQEARASPERVQSPTKLISRTFQRSLVLQNCEELARVVHLPAERRDEVGASAAGARAFLAFRTRGAAGHFSHRP